MRQYYIAINAYRSSTSNGFGNTWNVYSCSGRAEQLALLRDGLPVSDCWYSDMTPVCSTMGIRLATRGEIAAYRSRRI